MVPFRKSSTRASRAPSLIRDEAVMMLPRVIALDRHAVRRRFEQRFSSARMATDYVALYRSLLKRPSMSERETTVPLPQPVLEKRLKGLHGERASRADGSSQDRTTRAVAVLSEGGR